MSDKFNGFSQDEINKVSGAKSKAISSEIGKKEAFRSQHVGIRRMPEKWSKPAAENLKKQQVNRPQTAPLSKKEVRPSATRMTAASSSTDVADQQQQDTMDEVNLDRSMSKSLEEALFYQPLKATTGASTNVKNAQVKTDTNGATSSNDDSSILKLPPAETGTQNDVSSSTDANDVNNDSSILPTQRPAAAGAVMPTELNVDSPFKGISLKDFETHRKMIQEQNKQKKELLYKAIEHHSQKTAAETRKIEEIKSELAKLDNDLAVDVAILRKQIDNACINFANIEKQYIKIEAQFLKSKMELHHASEKKELLTEHLCTVIAHNEDRKAQKLSELMQKVGLTPTGELDVTSTSNCGDNGTN